MTTVTKGVKIILGLIVVLFVLWLIEQNAPEYQDIYIAVILLGVILANSDRIAVFANQLSARII